MPVLLLLHAWDDQKVHFAAAEGKMCLFEVFVLGMLTFQGRICPLNSSSVSNYKNNGCTDKQDN